VVQAAEKIGKRAVVKRGRGRPARLSREAIVEAGLALLDREPEEPLTLLRVAGQVDAVPAALYRHVGSLDELLDGVLARVLEEVRFEIRRRASWRSQVRDWMRCMRAHLLRYPGVVRLIGRRGRTSPAWFDATSVLIEILERAGLRGATLARAYLWIAETTMGVVVNEASVPFTEQIAAAGDALADMSLEARGRHEPLMVHLGSMDAEDAFELVADRTIAAIAEWVEGTR
jgi:TetR/AcrR family transcriptional regulator, tetracycline repressor protein